jgi:hypothetical protein
MIINFQSFSRSFHGQIGVDISSMQALSKLKARFVITGGNARDSLGVGAGGGSHNTLGPPEEPIGSTPPDQEMLLTQLPAGRFGLDPLRSSAFLPAR